MIRTLLIDGSYILKRSIEGDKNTYSRTFGHIGGLYQAMTTTRQLINKYQPNKVIVVWDGENGGVLRYLEYPKYKSNRPHKKWGNKIHMTPEQIETEKRKKQSYLKQKKRFQQYLEELCVRQIEVDDIEADDLIAQYTMTHNTFEDIYIFCYDVDITQLLEYNVKIIFKNADTLYDKDNFAFNFGYHYKNVVTFKTICGDSSDCIEGVGGISTDTLLKLIPESSYKFVTVRDFCLKAKEINEKRLDEKKKPLIKYENITNGLKTLIRNHKLVNLSEPYLNDNAYNELENLDAPLDLSNRDWSRNLYKMMNDDLFLDNYIGNLNSYVMPFHTIIAYERSLYEDYLKSIK